MPCAVVLYCLDLKRTKTFYETLGLRFVAEKHGNGPSHFACDFGGRFAIELYPAPSSDGVYASPLVRQKSRLVIPVLDFGALMPVLAALKAPMTGPKASSSGPTLLTEDPDGREVLLMEVSS